MKKHLRSRRLFQSLSFFLPAVLAFSLLSPSPSNAQASQPHITFVFPQGVQRGKTIEATVSGKDLTDAQAVRITGGGVTAGVVKVENPSTVRISVSMAPEAELGERDLRVITPNGASNRFRFVVGDLPELNETEPNSETSQAQPLESLPILINGQILPSDRDFFRFTAKAGQTLVCEVHARTLLPYIADTVPGWLEACLTLYDSGGKQLKYVDKFRFHPDPVLVYHFQEDGEFLLEIRDLIYRGRGDFIYRLTLGASPFITHIFPLGWQRNSDAQIELHGVNLPTQSMNFNLPADLPPRYFVRVNHNGLASNTLPFAVGDAGEARETEPNDSVEQANKVQVPVAINGRIQASGDTDHFAFTAKQGERLIMEVQARRLDSPLDSVITLFNSAGQELQEQDDTDMGEPLLTHHADSRVDYTFPADGDYILRIRDIQGNWGEEYAYRLLVAPPHPDYMLQIVPDNPHLEPGDTALVTAHALRKDGFNGEIKLSAQNLPSGFVASDAVIPAGQTRTRLTITAPPNAPAGLFSPSFQGTAVDDKAKAEYDAAEKAAQEAETAAANAKAAADTAAAAQANAEKDAAAKRQRANEAKKKVDDLVEKKKKPAEANVAAAAKAVTDATTAKAAADKALAEAQAATAKAQQAYEAAEKAAAEAEMAAATAKAEADKARAAQAAAEKVVPEKRKLADDARAKLGPPLVRQAVPAEEVMQAFSLKHDVPTQEFLLSASAPATFALSTNIPVTEVREVPQGSELSVVVKASREGIKAALGRAAAEKKAADEALAKVKGDLEKAKADYAAAEKAAREAETAAANAKAAVSTTAAAQANAEKDAVAKRRQANEAKKKVDHLVQQQKPAEVKVAAAAKTVTDATTAKAAADKALADAQAATAAAQQAYEAAEKAAQEAEANAKAVSEDAGKSEEEKKQAAEEAAAQRKAADEAKTALTGAQGKEQPAQTQANTAAQKLAEAEAQKKPADEALASVKNQVTAASNAYQAAEEAVKVAEAAAAMAKAKADKARATQVAAEKAAPEKRKLAGEAKARQDQLTKDEKAANTKAAEATKKADAAKKDAEGQITLAVDAPPGGISVKSAVIPADKDEVTITLAVAKQVAVGFRQNIIISGSTKIADQNVTRFAPAIPIRVIAAPQ